MGELEQKIPHWNKIHITKAFNRSSAHLVPTLCEVLSDHMDRLDYNDSVIHYESQLLKICTAGENKKVTLLVLNSIAGVIQYLKKEGVNVEKETEKLDYFIEEYRVLTLCPSI